MTAIQLQTGPQYWRRLAIIWVLFGVIGFAMAAVAKAPLLGFSGLFQMIAPAYLPVTRYLWWVKRIDADGVALLSGKRFAWADFDKVMEITVSRYGSRRHNHYELVFKTGRGRVFDLMLKNRDEVLAALKALEAGERPSPGAAQSEVVSSA